MTERVLSRIKTATMENSLARRQSDSMTSEPIIPERNEEVEKKTLSLNLISLKAETWITKKGMSWPGRATEKDGGNAINRSVWPSIEDNDSYNLRNSSESNMKQSNSVNERSRNEITLDAQESSSSFNADSSNSINSSGSTSSNTMQKVEMEIDCLDYEIVWEDLSIGVQIGQGICLIFYRIFPSCMFDILRCYLMYLYYRFLRNGLSCSLVWFGMFIDLYLSK